ncbi:MAG: formylglycine-generating enzyme family protein, partial [Thermoguttaceae bacterium]|nr:formylglycine-generating enzyme family protein [Thermoguttaceae bacterium]
MKERNAYASGLRGLVGAAREACDVKVGKMGGGQFETLIPKLETTLNSLKVESTYSRMRAAVDDLDDFWRSLEKFSDLWNFGADFQEGRRLLAKAIKSSAVVDANVAARIEEALTQIRDAGTNNSQIFANFDFAFFRFAQGRVENAFAWLERIARLAPNEDENFWAAARAKLVVGDFLDLTKNGAGRKPFFDELDEKKREFLRLLGAGTLDKTETARAALALRALGKFDDDFPTALRDWNEATDGWSAPIDCDATLRRLCGDAQRVRDEPASWTNALGIWFLHVRPGAFWMGSPATERGRESDETQRKTMITRSFYLAAFPTTQGEWRAATGKNPSFFHGGARLPVESVSRADVGRFLEILNSGLYRENLRAALGDGWRYDLPTEAQWEFACRAGSTAAFSGKRSLTTADANFNGTTPTSGRFRRWFGEYGRPVEAETGATKTVGSYPPNALGFFDMRGNVWEWVRDQYGVYDQGTVVDPKGPSLSTTHVCRGGSWRSSAERCRS